MKWVLLLAAALAIGICAWLMADGFAAGGARPTIDGETDAVAPSAKEPPSRPVAPVTAVPFRNPEPDAAPSPLLPPVEGGAKLRIVDGDTSTAVAAAEVICSDAEALDAGARAASPDDRTEREDLFRQFGKRFRTGEDGTVTVPRSNGGLWVFARMGPASGAAWIRSPYPDVTEIVIHKDVSIAVHVVDAAGRNVGDIEIACVLVIGGQLSGLNVGRTRVEDGVVHFRNVLMGVAPEKRRESGTLEIFPRNAPVKPIRFSVRLDAVPSDPITLRLHPVGTVIVKLETQTGAPEPNVGVSLRVGDRTQLAAGTESTEAAAPLKTDVNGSVRFDDVAAGVPLFLYAAGLGFASATAKSDGIPSHGETITVRMKAGTPVPVLRFRLVDEMGRPCGRAQLSGHASVGPDDVRALFMDRTDDDGRIERNFPASFPKPVDAIEIRSESNGRQPTRAARVALPSPMKPGVNDLGEVVWKRLPAIVSGRVVDGSGAPVGGVMIALQVRRDARAGWDHATADSATAADDGSFTIVGAAPEGELGVICWGPWIVQTEPIPIVPGASGVALVVERAGGIRGRLLLPAGWDAREFRAYAAPANAAANDPVNRSIPLRVDPDGSFESDALPPGTYTFTVNHSGSPFEPLSTILGVDIVGGKFVDDPRLAPLHLADQCLFVRIRATNETKEPIPGIVADVALPDFPNLAVRSFHSLQQSGEIRLVIPNRRPRTITVGAPGYRTVTLTDVTTDRDVVLSAGFRVELAFTNVPKLPEGFHLIVIFEPVSNATGGLERIDSVRSGIFRLDEAGAATGAVPAAGSFAVSLTLIVDDLGPEPRSGQAMYGLPASALKATVADQPDPQPLRFTLADTWLAELTKVLDTARKSQRH